MIIIISEWYYLQLWEMCIGKGTKFLHQRNIRNQAIDNSLHLFICYLFIYLKLVWIVIINQKVNFYDNQ